MSFVIKCSFLGEEAVFGCGFSAAAKEVEKQLEFEVETVTVDAEPALSKPKSTAPSKRTARTEAVESPAVQSTKSTESSPAPVVRATKSTESWTAEQRYERFYSCEEEAFEVIRQSFEGKFGAEDRSEERSTVLDESTASAEEATSVASTEADAPSSRATDPQEAHAVEKLRKRLSDVLGPLNVDTLGDASARGTVERLGGYPTCFWRFLRSCNWDMDAADRKLRETFTWRESIGANSFLENPKALQVYKKLKDVWPEVHLGSSSDGSPVSYFDLGKAVHFLSLGYDEDTIRTYWLYWMERSNAFQREGRSRASGSISGLDMPGTVVVYNLEGLRLSQLTSCLSGLHCFIRVLSLAEQHYPSNLRKAVIMNPPSIFSKMVWPLVQKALDAETLSNVVVCDGSYESLTAEELGFSPSELTELLKDI